MRSGANSNGNDPASVNSPPEIVAPALDSTSDRPCNRTSPKNDEIAMPYASTSVASIPATNDGECNVPPTCNVDSNDPETGKLAPVTCAINAGSCDVAAWSDT